MSNFVILSSSFRDPSGFLFSHDGVLYRQVNMVYKEDYDCLIHSGLYDALVKDELLVSHENVTIDSPQSDSVYKVIKPNRVEFIAYPYEWCFSQLKAAALATLNVQKKALDFDMSLKDCSAYNIQFFENHPLLIDTLSFEKYIVNRPWVAYRQFCQHFLAPLALMSHRDIRLGQLLRTNIDGIPLDLASKLLPLRTRFRLSLLSHIHLHAKSQGYFASRPTKMNDRTLSRRALIALVDNLASTVEKLDWSSKGTEWVDYYEETNYSSEAIAHKWQIIDNFVNIVQPRNVWDLGANIGTFSRIASDKGIATIAFDVDPGAVEKNYLDCVKNREKNILPLLVDLTNISPSIGWHNQERLSLIERGPTDMVFALALIHHLAISNNLPFGKIAKFLSNISKSLAIEFIPKDDSQVMKLLVTRKDIFQEYTQENFERSFRKYFTIREVVQIKDSKRIMYLMEKSAI